MASTIWRIANGRAFLTKPMNEMRRSCLCMMVTATSVEAEPIGVQIGLVPGTLPHTGFQIFRAGDFEVPFGSVHDPDFLSQIFNQGSFVRAIK